VLEKSVREDCRRKSMRLYTERKSRREGREHTLLGVKKSKENKKKKKKKTHQKTNQKKHNKQDYNQLQEKEKKGTDAAPALAALVARRSVATSN
jgi:hypothetical protein